MAIKLAAVQMRFGLIVMEFTALSLGQIADRSEVETESAP